MRRKRNSKKLIIVCLMIVVMGLSIGFSAFSNTITIKAGANVKPSATAFSVVFSSSADELETNVITPTLNPSNLTAAPGVISNVDEPTISGLGVTFVEPGQSATYTFYSYNSGQYTAYLKKISFGEVDGSSLPKVCTASTGTSQSLVDQACNGITLSVQVGEDSAVTETTEGISGHTIEKGDSEQITVVISYESGATVADGDFQVKFGDIKLNYSSVN